MTSTAASESSTAQRSDSSSIFSSSSFVTDFIRMREEWKVKRSGSIASRARSMAGISVSIVTLELGTMRPTRNFVFDMSDRHYWVGESADALDVARDDVAGLQERRWGHRGAHALR